MFLTGGYPKGWSLATSMVSPHIDRPWIDKSCVAITCKCREWYKEPQVFRLNKSSNYAEEIALKCSTAPALLSAEGAFKGRVRLKVDPFFRSTYSQCNWILCVIQSAVIVFHQFCFTSIYIYICIDLFIYMYICFFQVFNNMGKIQIS